jgi:hypothetical protein
MKSYYLDTCAWSDVLESEAAHDGFVSFFRSRDRVAAASIYCLFELSYRAPEKIAGQDSLFFNMRRHIYVPSFNDQLVEGELESFPNTWEMCWLPLSVLLNENTPSLLQVLSSKPEFINIRDGHVQFGLENYPKVEEFKVNFPPIYADEYTVDDANPYSWAATLDWLSRHFPEFLQAHGKVIKKGDFATLDSILSVRASNLFIFFKYYLQGQSPLRKKSDFFDFLHTRYAPYCDVFVTERDACNVLRRIKHNGLILPKTRILHLSDFLAEMNAGKSN